ncbi:DUF2442 domain-containing protein [Thermus sp.]|uniref:DUF2442 domain-containing protein n=1 Tax=Thermus sp. TaxID=275 RepID=UPI003D0F2E07
MVVEVVEARPLEGLRLWLRFSDGKEGVVALEALELPGLLSRLRDPDFFAQVRVDPELGAPVWPGGLDLDPLVLYARALGAGLPLQALPQVNPSD